MAGSSGTGGKARESWGSNIGFILAVAGSAIGLGNIWRFPFLAGRNGGAAFVLVYIIIIVLIGFSMLVTDFVVGRHGQANAVDSFRKISKKFVWMGYLGLFSASIAMAYYSVTCGWIIYYMINSFGALANLSLDDGWGFFGGFISRPVMPLVFTVIYVGLTVLILIGGIKKGIERWNKILLPTLFVLIIILVIRTLTLPGALEGVEFYLKPDFSKITWAVIVAACGQVFFSLNIGTTGMVVYGSYLKNDIYVPKSTLWTVGADTLAALLAGFIVIPAAIAFGIEPGSGPGLIFVTLPGVFSQIPLGGLFSFMFFALLLFACLTSSVSILEITVAFVVEKTKLNRKKAATAMGLLCFVLGIPVSFSFGMWEHIMLFGKGIFDLYDGFVSNIAFPLTGLCTAIMVGWVWGKKNAIDEVSSHGLYKSKLNEIWFVFVRYICPVGLAAILWSSLRQYIGF